MKRDKLIKSIEEKNNIEPSLHPPIPKKNFLVEVTNACNSQCIFCANRKMTRKIGSINEELLKKILTDAYSEGVREVGFYTTGEPFICKNIGEYIAIAKKIGFDYIYITTNGVLASLDKVKSLIDKGLDSIKFSINGIDKETYKLIHGKDDFDTVIRNLKEINAYKRESKKTFNLYVSYIMTRYSLKDKGEIKKFFNGLCDEAIILNTVNQSGLTPEIETMLKVQSEQTDMDCEITLPCNSPFNTINVSYEGYLTACCADFQNYLAYADLNNVSISEAWNNDIIVNLRKMHINGTVGSTLCANCVYNTLNKPIPLVEELAMDFDVDKMFDFQAVENRINKFINRKDK